MASFHARAAVTAACREFVPFCPISDAPHRIKKINSSGIRKLVAKPPILGKCDHQIFHSAMQKTGPAG